MTIKEPSGGNYKQTTTKSGELRQSTGDYNDVLVTGKVRNLSFVFQHFGRLKLFFNVFVQEITKTLKSTRHLGNENYYHSPSIEI